MSTLELQIPLAGLDVQVQCLIREVFKKVQLRLYACKCKGHEEYAERKKSMLEASFYKKCP